MHPEFARAIRIRSVTSKKGPVQEMQLFSKTHSLQKGPNLSLALFEVTGSIERK